MTTTFRMISIIQSKTTGCRSINRISHQKRLDEMTPAPVVPVKNTRNAAYNNLFLRITGDERTRRVTSSSHTKTVRVITLIYGTDQELLTGNLGSGFI